jgi:hypothetical protein
VRGKSEIRSPKSERNPKIEFRIGGNGADGWFRAIFCLNAKAQRRKGAMKKEPVGRWHLKFENILMAAITLWLGWGRKLGNRKQRQVFSKTLE